MDLALLIGIILAVGQMVYNGLLGLFMFGLKRKFAQHDDLRIKVEQRDDVIRAQVDLAVKQELGSLADAIHRIDRRLEEGEKRFERLGDTDHQAELNRRDELHQLRLYVTQHCATKSSVENLSKQIAALREDVVRVESTRTHGGGA